MGQKKWTTFEEGKASEMIQNNFTYTEIGKILDRSRNSIKNKLNKLGYTYRKYNSTYFKSKCLHCGNEYINSKELRKQFCNKSCSTSHMNKLRKL